jgi:hypothetical protein
VSHEISAIVATDAASAAVCARYLSAVRVKGRNGWWVVPLTRELTGEMGSVLLVPDLEETGADAALAAALGPIVTALPPCPADALVLAFTQYFGGVGAQGAAVVREGRFELGPIVAGDAIDRALRLIGVRREAGRDEFDTVGLGRWRRLDELKP